MIFNRGGVLMKLKCTAPINKICKKFNISSENGFSLIEVLIVIAIMVILLSMLIPATAGYIRKAQLVSDKSSGRTIYEAYQMALNDPTFYAKAVKVAKTANTTLESRLNRMPAGIDRIKYAKYCPILRTGVKGKGDVGDWAACHNKIEHKQFAKMFQLEFDSKKLHVASNLKPADPNAIANSRTDQFVIIMKKGNPRDIEVWLGSSGGFQENGLTVKLYPN